MCEPDQNGDFLIPSKGAIESVIVGYKYQMEMGKNSANITAEVIPDVEKAILDAILPELFDVCNTRRLIESEFQWERKLAVLGASSKPVDTISTVGKISIFMKILSFEHRR